MVEPLDILQATIGWTFKDPDLLRRALTHSSHGDGAKAGQDNERLEFLGDRILGLLAAEKLFRECLDAREGQLARQLNALVNRDACARAAVRAGVDQVLRMSRAEAKSGGRAKPTILGDACEALLAALYLDGGLDAARVFFQKFWAEEVAAPERDPKTALQEWAQARKYPTPQYLLVERTGPDHAPEFVVEAHIGDLAPERGSGNNKQAAERAAAIALFARENTHD